MEIFCFLLGVLYGYTAHFLLPTTVILLFFITPRYPVILLFLLGLILAFGHQKWVTPQGMPDLEVIPYAQIKGTIASIPIISADKTQFHFALEQIDNHPAQGLIQLAWYNKAPQLHVGESWLFSVKLKKPRNFRNPGGFDYVTALAKKHISWTGYIRPGANKLLNNKTHLASWLRLREQLGESLTQLAPDLKTAGIIEALTLNLTTHINQNEWDLFRRTGTTHLFGISGEHIALISGLVFFMVRWLWSRSVRCCLLMPAVSFASIAALLVALLYAFLAGFEPPVQRALIGCFFYTLSYIGKQRFTSWQIWRYALFLVLCLEPHAVLMQGFYFSFLAVACILLTQQRWQFKGYKASLAIQFSCLAGLMPLTLYWYSYGSVNGFIANLFAIPLVGFLIVPLALLVMLISNFSWASLLMLPLSWLITLLFKGLLWIEHLAVLNINWPINSIIYVLSLMGFMLFWVLLPVKPFKHLALIWLLVPLFPKHTLVKHGEALVQVLDVGQGLAVSIRTQNHILLYDTGDQFFRGNDFGTMVVLPFFAAEGINYVDKIVISHPDKDHRGGLKSVEEGVAVAQLLVNDRKYYHRGLNCHDYPQWRWDGVNFRFFPIKNIFNDKNNNSCTLQISTKKGSVLLPGDIEKTAEDYLVRTYGNQLASDFLIVPHHGSKTSSSWRFLLEVAPRYAIASLGFDNRFHFPHAKTLNTMRSQNIAFIRTDECGMVNIHLPATGLLKQPQCSVT